MDQPAMLLAPLVSREHPRFTSASPSSTNSDSGLHRPAIAGEIRKPKLLDQVREVMRTRHYSLRTEDTYIHWIKRFIFFHNKRHPREMSEAEIGQFLSHLATNNHVSASTQIRRSMRLSSCIATCLISILAG